MMAYSSFKTDDLFKFKKHLICIWTTSF